MLAGLAMFAASTLRDGHIFQPSGRLETASAGAADRDKDGGTTWTNLGATC